MGINFKAEEMFAGRQILGDRDAQEDAYAFAFAEDNPTNLIGVLGDGMGGHSAGDVASSTAVNAFIKALSNQKLVTETIPQLLQKTLQSTNDQIQKALVEKGFGGTTLVAFTIHQGFLNWISVGDSILALHRNGYLRRLNEDQSMRTVIDAEWKNGKISKEEAMSHPDRNALLSALSGESIEKIDCPNSGLELRAGDILVAATDGIDHILNSTDYAETLLKNSSFDASKLASESIQLSQAANSNQQDNTTVMVVKISRPTSAEAFETKHKR